MTDTYPISVKLFGAARELDPSGLLSLNLPIDSTAKDVKHAILSLCDAQAQAPALKAVLEKAVIATNETILTDLEPIPTNTEIAILPPVAGG